LNASNPYTHGHTQRVKEYATIMAKALGRDESEISALRRASVLHDIGKIGIEDLILRKQGRLEPDEEMRMQRHPIIGVEMLKGIDFLDPVLPLIRHHHERWDGNGYPDQLGSDEIPLGARILAVADALDAMTSDRSYRAARTFEYAKTEILKGSATHFDPEVVTAFIKSQRAIAGVTSGKMGLGDTVTWRATHFGVPLRLSSRITEFDPPRRFVDEMVEGPLRRLRHVHAFEAIPGGTLMVDVFQYASPLGIL